MAINPKQTRAVILACVGAALAAGLPAHSARADEPAPSAAADPFAPLRQKQVLFNGWGLSPAGQHVQIGSMPGCMVLSPDGTRLLATSSGASQGLSVVDVVNRQQTQFIPLDRAFNGACFSNDGKHVFVTGGNSDRIHCFDYADGKVRLDKTVSLTGKPAAHAGKKHEEEVDDFLTGLAVHLGLVRRPARPGQGRGVHEAGAQELPVHPGDAAPGHADAAEGQHHPEPRRRRLPHQAHPLHH